MALSVSLQSLYPIVRHAQCVVHTHNVVGPRLLVRNISALKILRPKDVSSNKRQGALCAANLSAAHSTPLLGGNGLSSTCGGLLQQVRTICGRENCADPCDFPPCAPENIVKTDCMKKKMEREKNDQPLTVYEVYWNKPECCANECIEAFPRFDDMYYRESDKENRIYTQTWNECPDMVILPKPICCPDKIKYPPLCKRAPKDKPKTACNMDDTCPPDLATSCPKIRSPCCRPARTEPCKRVKTPKECIKFNAPSPSFSECRKPDLRAQKISECWCLAAPSMCTVWAEWRRLQKIKRK